jgi:hypothetical protein
VIYVNETSRLYGVMDVAVEGIVKAIEVTIGIPKSITIELCFGTTDNVPNLIKIFARWPCAIQI